VIEGFPLLGETLDAAIAAERAAFEAVRGPFDPVPAGAAGPSFNVSFEILAASGDVLGVHLLFYAFFGANGAESSATFWFDLAANRALAPVELLGGDAGLASVVEELRAALEARFGPALFPNQVDAYFAAAAENLQAVGFTADGDLLVIFDEGSVGPNALGRIAIALPTETVEPYLSDFGRRARAETLQPSGPLRVPATPTPEPTAVPPAPPSTGGVDCGAAACVALTFDDGPAGPTLTLLDMLAKAGAPATFFVVGVNAQYQPALLQRMAAEGHEIGNHTYDHRDLTTLSAEQIAAQWRTTSEIVAAATGLTPAFFRPPYGVSNETVRSVVKAPFILWSVDPRDWADRDTATVARRVLETARAGDIVLLHDIYVTSVDAVPAIIAGLRQRGFTLVTVSTLLGGELEPGASYSRR
jgi:peptidoglycan/xylan/chitin deacetylase (PgdA/CDA1 family)